MARSLGLVLILLTAFPLSMAARRRPKANIDQMQLPADYGIDIQLGLSTRPVMMHGADEMIGTPANVLGDGVFDSLVKVGFSQPYPWKLTLVDNSVVNAGSTAGGQVYVYGGLVKLLGNSPGLWAATMSHEVAHTGLRHQLGDYMQRLYIARTVAYYQARMRAGDKSASWALIGFSAAAPMMLKKMEREQEHAADETGMLLMARAGYHPDYVFALHHLLLMQTGEQSKFAAFFSDHPRWETRDQRSEKEYSEALAEYNRLWPKPELSPGGAPPPVAFLGSPIASENKPAHEADVAVPLTCRNEPQPVTLLFVFFKNGQVIKTGPSDKDMLHFSENISCPEDAGSLGVRVQIPASTISGYDRKLDAQLVVVTSDGTALETSKRFKIVFPKN